MDPIVRIEGGLRGRRVFILLAGGFHPLPKCGSGWAIEVHFLKSPSRFKSFHSSIVISAHVANNSIMEKKILPALFVLLVVLLAAPATVQARSLEIKWIEVEGGAFTPAGGGATRPITLDGFFMSATEVTFDQFDAYCEATGARKSDDAGWGRGSRPVLNVSWDEAVAFCRWLSREIGAEIRLPNEAEWEYAALGGNRSKGYRYSGSNAWQDVSWSEGNSGGAPHPVGEKKPNELGLYDMSGNLWEMCEDWPAGDPAKPRSDSGSRDGGAKRAAHGNSYDNPASDPRRADVHVFLGEGHINVGFRVVKTIKGDPTPNAEAERQQRRPDRHLDFSPLVGYRCDP